MSDEMIQRLAENSGVIQIAWGSSFVNDEYRLKSEKARQEIAEYLKENDLSREDEQGREFIRKYREENAIQHADISDVVDHIDHVVQLVGVDHVGFGSDFDGVGDSLPVGLEDVSDYPNLIFHLLQRGYSESEIEKICSGNLLRVWSEVERIATELQSPGS